MVAYLNDEAYHVGMVTFASTLLRMGRNPLSAWYPLLNLGSPNYLHYQSLPSIITGAVGIVTGDARTFAWSKYLLLATWPISMYLGSRLLGWGRWTAAAVACASPLIMDAAGVGYGYGSYLWIGWGVWTQLWAMWTLPLAVGFSWQAVTQRRHLVAAVVFTGLTIALHYMTAYPAVIAIVVLGLSGPWTRAFWQRFGRAVVLGALSLGAAAWVLIPVISQGKFAARNEFLQHTVEADSFGARRILSWLVTGQLLDKGRFPILTILLAVGLVACVIRFRRDERYGCCCACGWSISSPFRPTDPGSAHQPRAGQQGPFLAPVRLRLRLRKSYRDRRRSHRACEAGLSAFGAGEAAPRCNRRDARRGCGWPRTPGARMVPSGELHALNARDISLSGERRRTQGVQIASLIRVVEALGGGRVYAGL